MWRKQAVGERVKGLALGRDRGVLPSRSAASTAARTGGETAPLFTEYAIEC